jgi:hypothetical protein
MQYGDFGAEDGSVRRSFAEGIRRTENHQSPPGFSQLPGQPRFRSLGILRATLGILVHSFWQFLLLPPRRAFTCVHMATLALEKFPTERAVDWDEQKQVFDVPDPYLLFYLRWSGRLREQ